MAPAPAFLEVEVALLDPVVVPAPVGMAVTLPVPALPAADNIAEQVEAGDGDELRDAWPLKSQAVLALLLSR